MDFFYSLYSEIPKSILTIIIVSITTYLLCLIVHVKKENKHNLNEALKTGNEKRIREQ
jgi:hypothetical protein